MRSGPGRAVVRVRMGIHTGEATLGEDGYVGFAVHQASRIGDAGHGGQILLSSTTARLVEHDLPRDVTLRDLGENRLDGLDRPERLYQLVVPGLADVFPPLATRATTPVSTGGGPVLLEREAELAALRAMIEVARGGNGRFVAIEGNAGIGKTRLVGETSSLASVGGDACPGRSRRRARARVLVRDRAPALRARARALVDPPSAKSCSRAPPRSRLRCSTSAGLSDPEALADNSFATLHGLFWLAGTSRRDSRCCIAVDDLHWGDAASLRWLSYTARRLEGLPILVVAGTRLPPSRTRKGSSPRWSPTRARS